MQPVVGHSVTAPLIQPLLLSRLQQPTELGDFGPREPATQTADDILRVQDDSVRGGLQGIVDESIGGGGTLALSSQ